MLKMALATNFSVCNSCKFRGNERIQCLKLSVINGYCEKHRYGTNNISLLSDNIEMHNYKMVKYCLKNLSLSNYEIMYSCMSINTLTPKPLIDLIYFNDVYEQQKNIHGKPALDRVSIDAKKFICEKLFLIHCLLDEYEDKGLMDLKNKIIITKINEKHLKYLHSKIL